MLGHYSIKQTEEYAITEQATIGREMKTLGKEWNCFQGRKYDFFRKKTGQKYMK